MFVHTEEVLDLTAAFVVGKNHAVLAQNVGEGFQSQLGEGEDAVGVVGDDRRPGEIQGEQLQLNMLVRRIWRTVSPSKKNRMAAPQPSSLSQYQR